jgi:hypothetical protein
MAVPGILKTVVPTRRCVNKGKSQSVDLRSRFPRNAADTNGQPFKMTEEVTKRKKLICKHRNIDLHEHSEKRKLC